MDDKNATRDRILEAASARIKRYGYSKTTMAEIAADCAMSPANIYRFFEAKIDIAEAMARNHYAESHARLAAVARNRKAPAADRLREAMFLRLRDSFALLEASDKILEVADVLHRERPLFANEMFCAEREHLGGILKDGVAEGAFAPLDPDFASEMLQAATMKFAYPQLFSRLGIGALERELSGVVDLLLQGLRIR